MILYFRGMLLTSLPVAASVKVFTTRSYFSGMTMNFIPSFQSQRL